MKMMYLLLYLQNWGTDFDLNTKQSADIIAFTAMMEEKLLPALVSKYMVHYLLNYFIGIEEWLYS